LYFSYKSFNPLAICEPEDDVTSGGPGLQGLFFFFSTPANPTEQVTQPKQNNSATIKTISYYISNLM
jgi:hypothetical protein